MRAAVSYMSSLYYVWTVGGVTTLLNIAGLDVLNFYFLCLTMCFALLFCEDTLPFMASLIYTPFTVSARRAPYTIASSEYYSDPVVLGQLIFLCVLLAAVFFIRFFTRREWKKVFRKRLLTYGFFAVGAALALNGLFSGIYAVISPLWGIMLWICMVGLYYYLSATLIWEKRETLQYAANVFFMLGVDIALQMAALYLANPSFIDGSLKDYIRLGWGVSNTIGNILLMTLPFGLYLTHTGKRPAAYFLLSTGILVATVFTYSRAALIFAVPVFIASLIFSCVSGRNRLTVVTVTSVIAAAFIIYAVSRTDSLKKIFDFYIQNGLDDRGRLELWLEGLREYLKAPVFGYGFAYRFGDPLSAIYFLHNTLLQYLCACGVVGLVCYLYHRAETVWLFLKRMTAARLYMGMSVAGVLGYGLLGGSMTNPVILLFMGAIYALAEKDYLETHTVRALY